MPTDKQRRDAQRRKLQRQMERRREQAAKRKRNSLIGSIVGAVVVIGLIVFFISETSSDSSTKTQAGSTPTPSTTPSATPSPSASAKVVSYPCTWTKSGTAAKAVTVPPTTKPPRTGTVAETVATTQGTMTFTLNRAAAPCAVESFVSLAKQKYFDKTPCHRLTSGSLSVLQCGDPTGTGTGGPGYSFDDELTGKETYTTGVLAMANSGANTNGSQFFIVYKASQLGPQYTIFGTVTKGLDVVDKVAAKGSTPAGDGKPKLPITITSVTGAQ